MPTQVFSILLVLLEILNHNPKIMSITEIDLQVDTLINQSMTMKGANRMLEMTFIDNGIYDRYDGKYKNGDEWLKGVGVDEVTEYAENTINGGDKYLTSLYQYVLIMEIITI